jgi:hypothetical protein
VKAALEGFEGYRFDVGTKQDSEWEQYLNVLYPSDEDLQRIANMDLIDVLEGQGDVHTVPREVQHWIYFASEQSRTLFQNAAITAGFKVLSESVSTRDFPFGIVLARTQSVEQNSIDATVIELVRLSRCFDGEYDGWETPVVMQ